MHDLVIIGSGPAGLTAAIYAARASLDVIIIENNTPGGQLINISIIDNYPGVQNVSGPDLAYKIYKQVIDLKVPFHFENIENIKKENDIFKIKTNKKIIESKAVLVATGTSPRKLGLPNEDKYSSRGISWCALCDGAFYKNEKIAVIGGGNSALEESLFLSNIVKHITIIQNLDHFTAEKNLIERILEKDNIDVIYQAKVMEFYGDEKGLTGLFYEDSKGVIESLDVQGVFEYVGLVPNSSFLQDLGVLDKNNFVETNDIYETTVKGLFAAGDITNKHIRQIVTATSDGAIVINNILKYLGVF